ncbi:MAG: DUF1501 domain-containing protein [Chitinophagaceae bacterium]|nr:DUF1501 domain-containing protein [Chitinophagaceae bacterium]
MVIKRKEFLKIGSLATASLWIPQFLKAFEKPGALSGGNKTLVIIQLSGGNDGLNTVIPVRNDIYYKLRPKLGIPKSKALAITDEAGLHPTLKGLRALYDEGFAGILNNVGYPNPDRSHFRSMDIWHTASDSREYLTTGWIGRFLDAQCKGYDIKSSDKQKGRENSLQAVEVDDILSLALKGESVKGIAVKDPKRLYGTANEEFFRAIVQERKKSNSSIADYLYKTLAETLSSADTIFRQSRLNPSRSDYPKTQLGNSLKTIASLIFSDIDTKIYYVSLGSFDTHIQQEIQQQRLFTELDEALTAFVRDLKKNNRFEDVLIFTFSEFGRRVAQNASGGTDHGTANNMFFISGALAQKGLLNPLPDLQQLDDGDLIYKVDFRNVYATVLNKWLKADDVKILGKKYDHLYFIKSH